MTEEPQTVSEEPQVVPLLEPRGGTPAVTDSAASYKRVCQEYVAATGPVAVDAERASGYRYGQRAYLVQLNRAGAGIALLDPVALPDLGELNAALGAATWVVHSASGDLPGLAEVGLVPQRLFDTELAARLLGWPRVGLSAVVARVFGYGLAKEHSAVDWSTRPLPEDWLQYAALDVDLLLELHEYLAAELAEQGKTEWAEQEFEHLRTMEPPTIAEPWRRTSGVHMVRDLRGLAVVRALWQSRDELARELDQAPGRVLPDSAIVSAAQAKPRSVADLIALPVFGGRANRRRAGRWLAAVLEGLQTDELPKQRRRNPDSYPPPRTWTKRDPEAADRLTRSRAFLAELAKRTAVPVENLLQPDLLRRLAWEAPADVADTLLAWGARPWQVELVATELTQVMGKNSGARPQSKRG